MSFYYIILNVVKNMSSKPTIIIHDTDLHGVSCGINALYTLKDVYNNVTVYSHFSLNANEPSTTPQGLVSVIETLGFAHLIILDIPIDIRNPKRYIDSLISHNQFKGRVLWLDHHGHSQWVSELNKAGVTAIVYGTSYDLSLSVPRMYGKVDSFTEKWALVGALADFDVSIADKVSKDLEESVCEYLDQVYKFRRDVLLNHLKLKYTNVAIDITKGNVGFLSYAIAINQIEVNDVLEVARELGTPLSISNYNIIGNVVYTTALPQMGLQWKTAWKLCMLTGCKVAIVPAYNPRTKQFALIIAKYWRSEPEIAQIIEEFIQREFAGRQIVGHVGARSISLMSESEIQRIPEIARKLNEYIESKIYTPKSTRLINEQTVARALHQDFSLILQKLTEILEEQRKMYEEYLKLKKRQVELLEETRRHEYD